MFHPTVKNVYKMYETVIEHNCSFGHNIFPTNKFTFRVRDKCFRSLYFYTPGNRTHNSRYGDLSCGGQRQIVRENAPVQGRAQMLHGTRRPRFVPPFWAVSTHYEPLVFSANHADPNTVQVVLRCY